ncbi:hypothetical protein JYU14_01745 [Simkania negevensis]|uniref:Uncharacterized protein n=1 Tax=Simkania negevensis TaxID=83561 RepID=A0ABS3AT19_9BACT|nr:hypothetical protein [Simkania negevensis]
MTYTLGWKEGNTAIYLDGTDCKYVAKNGNLAWRINNPGLIKSRNRFAKKNGSIGAWDKLAIFSTSIQGHQALKEWLRSRQMKRSDLYAISTYYSSSSSKQLAHDLASSSGLPPKTKLEELTEVEFESLLSSIEQLSGFVRTGDEEFTLLLKIAAKIECFDKENLYLVGKDLALTHDEAINWTIAHRLDAVVVHHSNGDTHLRSRPHYRMQMFALARPSLFEATEEPATIAHMVGENVVGQCVWGFINGISNTKKEAMQSALLISKAAENEQVVLLQNDQTLKGTKEFGVALLLKMGLTTAIVQNAIQFLRYLLAVSERQGDVPVIIFVHSQGATIVEHALTSLSHQEKQKIRIFTFGGWSFILPGIAHPESHNYTSISDLIPRLGCYNLQYLAMRKHEGLRDGLTSEEIVWRLAYGDATRDLDCFDAQVIKKYAQERCQYYRKEFERISNVTVLDSDNIWEHFFNNENYQTVLRSIVNKYRMNRKTAEPPPSSHLLVNPLPQ